MTGRFDDGFGVGTTAGSATGTGTGPTGLILDIVLVVLVRPARRAASTLRV